VEQGATHFRGGCWKGQNRPIVGGKPAYWGLGKKGVKILSSIQSKLKIPCVTEVQSIEQAEYCLEHDIFMLQVGARHMQNFPLLRFLAKQKKTVILKRGLGNTTDEWLGAAEHLGGPNNVILCERGTVHFDRTEKIRWRLDIVAMAFIKQNTKYACVGDPSHGSGDRSLVIPLSRAVLSFADGLMVEVHENPTDSPTDANQTIDFSQFREIAKEYRNPCCCSEGDTDGQGKGRIIITE